MATAGTKRETLDDLYREKGKAELIGGRIVRQMPTGFRPNLVALEITVSLRDQTRRTNQGVAFADNMGFTVPELPSGRETFSPDAAYYNGQPPANPMRFIEGAPTLAVEVRSENDYGPAAEAAMAEKRADYFLAGTLVVWDVDPKAELIHVYRSTEPDRPTTYARGQAAEAEPAVPGWRIDVGLIFGG
jgi:Uma2 family endonuclease